MIVGNKLVTCCCTMLKILIIGTKNNQPTKEIQHDSYSKLIATPDTDNELYINCKY